MLTAPLEPPVRVAVIDTVPAFSCTVRDEADKEIVPDVGVSTMVTVALLTLPRVAPPVGLLSRTANVSLPSTSASGRMATVNVLGAVSPSAHERVPLVAT